MSPSLAKLTRRNLLRTGAIAAAFSALPEWAGTARAAVPARNLLIVLNSGGWDVTYSLDPKPGSELIDGAQGSIRRFGEIPILSHPTRPSVDLFFERYAEMCSVINGVQVRSFIHTDCTRRIMTGTASDHNPDFGAIAAYEHGRDLPVPYLVLGNSALSGPLASITGRAGTTNQISPLLTPDGFLIAGSSYEPSEQEESLVRRYLEAGARRIEAVRGQRGSNKKQVAAFTKSLERADLLRKFAKGQGGFGKQQYTPELDVQIEVATTALQGGLCHSAMLESSGWDTHDDNTEQQDLHEALFKSLLNLNDALEQKGLLSKTVVVVLSEMGRTPKLNAAGGKDHWPVTSALVYGAGVRGNQVIGGSDAKLSALSLNLATGAVDPAGKQLQTGNLVAGVLKLTGIDGSAYFPGVEPLDALAI